MRNLRNVFRREDGFTLIELLVVIAVLGILAAIAVPRITGVRGEAEKAALESSAGTLRNAIEMNIAVTGDMPDIDEDDIEVGSGTDDNPEFDDGAINVRLSGMDGLTIADLEHETDVDDYEFNLIDEHGNSVEISAGGVGEVTTSP